MSPHLPVESGQIRRGPSPIRPFIRVGALTRGRFAVEMWDHGAWTSGKPRTANNIADGWPELATEADLNPKAPPLADPFEPVTYRVGDVTVIQGRLPPGPATDKLRALAASSLAGAQRSCAATWPGGQCDREPTAGTYCHGHYGQQRRKKPFTPLRGPHNALERATVPVRFDAHADTVQLLAEEATRRGVKEADVYREALDAHAERLGKSGG